VPDTVGDLLLLTSVIAIGFLVAVWFYESLSTRDVLVGRVMRLMRRLTPRRWVLVPAYVITVGVGIPILVVTWTLVLESALFLIGSVDRLGSISLIAVSVVGAARILAYVRQKTAHELAKAIPLALAFMLLTGGALNLEQKLTAWVERPDLINLTGEMILFLIALEIGLRLVTDTSHLVLAGIRRRRGIDSDLGVWRTLWGALRRPVAQAGHGVAVASTSAPAADASGPAADAAHGATSVAPPPDGAELAAQPSDA
jgi:hypothetical protein